MWKPSTNTSPSRWLRRVFVTLLLTGFAGLALLLASVGIYGVISYIAEQRAHEIGIRLALGARKGEILRMVIAKGLAPELAGLAIGIPLRLTRILSSLLYGLSPTDRGSGTAGMLHPGPPRGEDGSDGVTAVRRTTFNGRPA